MLAYAALAYVRTLYDIEEFQQQLWALLILNRLFLEVPPPLELSWLAYREVLYSTLIASC